MFGGTANLWDVSFDFNGRQYRAFKRQHTAEGHFYIHLQTDHHRQKKSLETNDPVEAVRRARLFLEIALGHRWQSVQRFQESRGETTLETIITLYTRVCAVGRRTAKNNILSIRKILDRV